MDEKKRCSLTNTELIETAREWVHKLAKSRGDAWCLRIPPDFNHDPDMIFTELCDRLESSAEARAEALREAADLAWSFLDSLGPTAIFGKEGLTAAILADEPKEREAEPCSKCAERKGAPACEFCGPPAWEAYLDSGDVGRDVVERKLKEAER